jgi:hypothetical protein
MTVTSIHGRRLGIGLDDQLVSRDINISQPCVDASITVSAEGSPGANQRTITIQLKDAKGNDIDYVETVEILVFANAARTAFATGGSTGIAIGTDGALLTVVAKKYFLATSEADGDIDLTWTDTGTESVAVGVRLPNGRIVMTDAFANAA